MLIRGLLLSVANTVIEEAFLNTNYIVSITKKGDDKYIASMIDSRQYHITKADFNKLVRSDYNGQ